MYQLLACWTVSWRVRSSNPGHGRYMFEISASFALIANWAVMSKLSVGDHAVRKRSGHLPSSKVVNTLYPWLPVSRIAFKRDWSSTSLWNGTFLGLIGFDRRSIWCSHDFSCVFLVPRSSTKQQETRITFSLNDQQIQEITMSRWSEDFEECFLVNDSTREVLMNLMVQKFG